jgi:hypothetical protein
VCVFPSVFSFPFSSFTFYFFVYFLCQYFICQCMLNSPMQNSNNSDSDTFRSPFPILSQISLQASAAIISIPSITTMPPRFHNAPHAVPRPLNSPLPSNSSLNPLAEPFVPSLASTPAVTFHSTCTRRNPPSRMTHLKSLLPKHFYLRLSHPPWT